MSLYKNWCFTLNNYTLADEQSFQDMPYSYLLYGREIGEQGTPHLQGYVQFKQRLRLTALKKLHPQAHWEPSKGSSTDNLTYCKKDNDYQEFGKLTNTKGAAEKGVNSTEERIKRNLLLRDTKDLNDLINDGTLSLNQVPCIEKARKILKEQARLSAPPAALDGDLPHLWYWGPSGTGKSLKARTDHPDAYLKAANKWWDGYDGENTVLIEDFDKKHDVLCHHMKLWADRYTFNAEVKGGSTGKIRPGLIIVTSNYHPRDIWTDPSDLEPIMRRFNVVEFDNTLYRKRKEKETEENTISKKESALLEAQDKETWTALSVEGKPGSSSPLAGCYVESFNYGQ